jgi:hypothetical protein
MVTLFLVLPLGLCGLLLALEAALPLGILSTLSGSALFYSLLSAAVLGATLAAGFRRRESPTLLAAWLFLFCGLLLFSLSELVELLVTEPFLWTAEVFEAASFFPLAIAVGYLAAPLRILILPARRRAACWAAAAAFLAAVCLVMLLPWLVLSRPSAPSVPLGHALLVLKPLLDALLVAPLAVVILVLGVRAGGAPFLLIGLGLLLALPADVLDSFHLASGSELQEKLAHLLAIGSQLYILAGGLLCALSGPRAHPQPDARKA